MKKIECIVSPKRLQAVEDAVKALGVGGMTVSEAKGFGNEQTRPDSYLFLPKSKVEIYCSDGQLNALVTAICTACHTGNLGDGKIAIYDLYELIRVRTGERGDRAV